MHRWAVVDGHRTARPLAPTDIFGVEAGHFRVGRRPGPLSIAVAQWRLDYFTEQMFSALKC
jgi:hypothetical protein